MQIRGICSSRSGKLLQENAQLKRPVVLGPSSFRSRHIISRKSGDPINSKGYPAAFLIPFRNVQTIAAPNPPKKDGMERPEKTSRAGIMPLNPQSMAEFPQREKLTAFERIGGLRIAIWAFSICLTFGSFAFLSFLWASDDSSVIWTKIVASGWTARSIAIASLLIRSSITLQAVDCTSMLACLVLCQFQTLLPDVANVAIMQHQNQGPLSMLPPLFRSGKHRKGFFNIAILVGLLTTTTFLQFTSTILLSDATIAYVTGSSEEQTLPFIYSKDFYDPLIDEDTDFVQRKPISYPSFAEYLEFESGNDDSDGVYDTGLRLRAYLPIDSDSDRNILQHYSGNATVFDTRVVCMAPSLGEISFSPLKEHPGSAPYITGLVGPSGSISNFYRTSKNLDAFNCSPAIPFSQPIYEEWSLSACRILQNGTLLSVMYDWAGVADMQMSELVQPGAEAFLIINASGSSDTWFSYTDPSIFDYLEFMGLENYEVDGEWLHIPSNDSTIGISLSLCYTSFSPANLNISASRSGNWTEPKPAWKDDRFDTLAIREQLDAVKSPITPERRGAFSLQFPNSYISAPYLGVFYDEAPTYPAFMTYATLPNEINPHNITNLLCTDCTGGDDTLSRIRSHPAQAALFNDIVRETRHPGLALQALYTALYGSYYYEHMYRFDWQTYATTIELINALIPTSWTGFIIVATVVSLHLCISCTVAIRFIALGGGAIIGDAWLIVSQLRSPDLNAWTGQEGRRKSSQVKKAMERRGMEKTWAGLSTDVYRDLITIREDEGNMR